MLGMEIHHEVSQMNAPAKEPTTALMTLQQEVTQSASPDGEPSSALHDDFLARLDTELDQRSSLSARHGPRATRVNAMSLENRTGL